jgi:hypothetical protein
MSSVTAPQPCDVRALCREIAERRDRPIHLVPASLPSAALCGLWISSERADYLVYEQATSPVHQEHIILHELSHLLCGHSGIATESLDRSIGRSSVGQLGGSTPARTRYSATEELEAELLASMLCQRLTQGGGYVVVPASEHNGAVKRLRDVLLYGR